MMPNNSSKEWGGGSSLLILSSLCLGFTSHKKPERLKDIFIVFNGPQICMTETLVFLTLKLVNLLISMMRTRAIIEFSNLSDFKVPQL